MKKIYLSIGLLFLVLMIACNGEKKMKKLDYETMKNVRPTAWQTLSQKIIFFGHQSVGFNIISGIQDIQKEHADIIDLTIVETAELENFKDGVFAHSKMGENKDPLSKINAFKKFVGESRSSPPDIGFFKFCYVDINAKTDINTVFDVYRDTIKTLQKTFPETIFIHVTVPLRVVQTGVKAWIKKIIRRPVGGYADNMKRNEYNRRIWQEYEKTEPIFDLAKAESTYADGTRCYFTIKGKTFYSLVPAYTDDGGHLNTYGRKIIARDLLVFLAEL